MTKCDQCFWVFFLFYHCFIFYLIANCVTVCSQQCGETVALGELGGMGDMGGIEGMGVMGKLGELGGIEGMGVMGKLGGIEGMDGEAGRDGRYRRD